VADTHQASAPPSSWSPLAVPAFRTVWTATLVANVGAWMASVGTAWLMTTLDPSCRGNRQANPFVHIP
jgi:hypothetical protein